MIDLIKNFNTLNPSAAENEWTEYCWKYLWKTIVTLKIMQGHIVLNPVSIISTSHSACDNLFSFLRPLTLVVASEDCRKTLNYLGENAGYWCTKLFSSAFSQCINNCMSQRSRQQVDDWFLTQTSMVERSLKPRGIWRSAKPTGHGSSGNSRGPLLLPVEKCVHSQRLVKNCGSHL